ncbi:MAG: pyridoxal phosphate-dependent aminotransferase [Proteobacteria bacterium]|nr:pyridoxal phosphate-dependent aminotransferase [Pseudomonadota bacterium]
MQKSLPKRCRDIKPFLAMEVLERAQTLEREGKKVLYMCVGEPDIPPHPAIEESLIRAVKEGKSSYTHSLGIIELREAISEYYHEKYGVSVSPEQIVVSSGTSPLMLLIFSLILERGKEFILPNPSYACYPNYVSFLEGKVSYFKLNNKRLNFDGIEKLTGKDVSGIIINSPSNPTGEVLSRKEIEHIAKLPINIVSDEIYHGLTYEGDEETILSYRDEAFVINGFSKAFSMTGFRLGYAVVPKKLIRVVRSLHQNFIICAPNFVQWAGISALKHHREIVKKAKEIMNARRKFLLDGLKKLGFSYWGNPSGAFYVLVDMKFLKKSSLEISLMLLEKYSLAVTPGIDFGTNAEGYVRLSYATSLENIENALKILGRVKEING